MLFRPGQMGCAALAALAMAGHPCAEERKDTTFQRFLLLPFGAYSEGTGAQFGLVAMLFERPDSPDVPGDVLTASAVGTAEGQLTMFLGPKGSMADGDIRYAATLQYVDWPGSYWKGGNDPRDPAWKYSMQSVRTSGNLLFAAELLRGRRSVLVRPLRAGIQFDAEGNRTSFDAPDSLPGLLRGGTRVGLGPMLQWDSRSHEGWPIQGSLVTVGRTWYSRNLGSDFTFERTLIDVRTYCPLPWPWTTLALASYWESVEGDVPFDRLASPDGLSRLRGLAKGRLRDNQQWVLQSELRFPLFWRFSGTTFAEAGKVGKNMIELRRNEFHTSLGGGLRFNVNPSRRLNFRVDIAHVDDGMGVAASFGEAF